MRRLLSSKSATGSTNPEQRCTQATQKPLQKRPTIHLKDAHHSEDSKAAALGTFRGADLSPFSILPKRSVLLAHSTMSLVAKHGYRCQQDKQQAKKMPPEDRHSCEAAVDGSPQLVHPVTAWAAPGEGQETQDATSDAVAVMPAAIQQESYHNAGTTARHCRSTINLKANGTAWSAEAQAMQPGHCSNFCKVRTAKCYRQAPTAKVFEASLKMKLLRLCLQAPSPAWSVQRSWWWPLPHRRTPGH